MAHPVLHDLTHHRYLRERLETAFPDADEETLMDTLDGMTSLTDSLAEHLAFFSGGSEPGFGAAISHVGYAGALWSIRGAGPQEAGAGLHGDGGGGAQEAD